MTDAVQSKDGEIGVLTAEILARRLVELRAIPADEVMTVNLSVPLAISTVLVAAPRVQAMRADICRAIAELNMAWIDDLEEYALVLNHFHGEVIVTPKPRGAVLEAADARKARRHLTQFVRLLVDRGDIPAWACPELKGSNGHLDIATDLNVLAKFLGAQQNVMATGLLSRGELEAARALGERLLRDGEVRTLRSIALKSATDLRDRAFTALLRAYAEARAAVTFVRRWHGDADTITPPLFAARLKQKRGSAKGAPVIDSRSEPVTAGSNGETDGEGKDQNHTQSPITCGRPYSRTGEEAGAADDPDPFL